MAKFLHSQLAPSFLLETPISYPKYLKFQESSRRLRRESFLFLDHRPCLTAGLAAKAENLLVPKSLLADEGIAYYEVSRGGDYTAHEPGQIVAYIHLDLKKRSITLIDFVNTLLQSVQNASLEIWGLELIENRSKPGLYLKDSPGQKLVSVGVLGKSYFTSFGIALNAVNHLKTFQYIHPCGGLAKDMVTVQSLGKIRDWEEERRRWVGAFLFHFDRLIYFLTK